MEKPQPTIDQDELLKTIKEQEQLINQLNKEKNAITNFKFIVKEYLDQVCIVDTDFYFKELNDVFPKLIGYSGNELSDRPFFEFAHRDDLERSLREMVKLSYRNPKIEFENRYISKEGATVFLQWKASLDPSNNLIYVIPSDVTEMRKTQQKLIRTEWALNEAQKIAKVGSWEFNLESKELNLSTELYEIFELENIPDEPELFNKLRSCFMEEDAQKLEKVISSTLVNNMPFEVEHRILVNDNKIKWVCTTVIAELDTHDNVVALKGTVQDVSQKKVIDETLKAKEKAESANKNKSFFLANMSHEIRTPLNGIVGFTDLLLKTNFDEDQLEYLKAVNTSAQTLMEIINNILDYSKIEAGKVELNYEDMDVFQLLNQIVNLFKYEANSKKLDLKLSIDPNIPKFLKADSFRLKQVLVNLLSNAMKFTFSGYVKIKVVALEEDRLYSKIKFSVLDTGIGIKECNQKKIFKSFVQADNSTTRKYGGTGLGLAISSQLLGLLGSELELNSTYGQGSEFFFTVTFEKVSAEETNDETIEEAALLNQADEIKTTSNPIILIAEDNQINRVLVKTLINRLIKNCILLEALDGAEAVRMAEEQLPNLILMDIHMPILNGYDATAEIKSNEKTKDIPIIALTAGNQTGEKERCLEVGMADFVAKPIIQKDLEDVLVKWLKI